MTRVLSWIFSWEPIDSYVIKPLRNRIQLLQDENQHWKQELKCLKKWVSRFEKQCEVEIQEVSNALVRVNKKARVSEKQRRRIMRLLQDDDIAFRLQIQPGHDRKTEVTCEICQGRRMGIEDYRQAILEVVG